jgi:hypothetical protein
MASGNAKGPSGVCTGGSSGVGTNAAGVAARSKAIAVAAQNLGRMLMGIEMIRVGSIVSRLMGEYDS